MSARPMLNRASKAVTFAFVDSVLNAQQSILTLR